MFSSDRFDDKTPQKSGKTRKIEFCDFMSILMIHI